MGRERGRREEGGRGDNEWRGRGGGAGGGVRASMCGGWGWVEERELPFAGCLVDSTVPSDRLV